MRPPLAAYGVLARALPTASVAVDATTAAAAATPETKVAAEPKLDRACLVYLEPREAIDGKSYFGQCAACSSFIPESTMRGAVRGDRCALFGAQFPITDDDSCHLWTPWPDGRPDEKRLGHNGEAMVRNAPAAVQPYNVGYRAEEKVRCAFCRHYEYESKTCQLMAALNAALPDVFALDDQVKPGGKCDLWTPPAPPEETSNG